MGMFREKIVHAVLALGASVALGTTAFAVPTLQVGAPGGTGEGTYADYAGSLSNPTEDDTAVTSGNTLYVAGAFKTNNSELQIGGKYTDPADVSMTPGIAPGTMGKNWSDFGSNASVFNSAFDSAGAILMAVIPDGELGSLGSGLTIDGNAPIFTSATYKSGFDVPNNHAPIQNQDYLFFDIGGFTPGLHSNIPDFADESASNQSGEIKTLTIGNNPGYSWIHFDVLALVTDTQGGGQNVRLVSTLDINPGSHDVTWKPGDDGPGDDEEDPNDDPQDPNGVPEPMTTTLGLMGAMAIISKATGRRNR